MRITLCEDHKRRFEATHKVTELEIKEVWGICSFCSCVGTVYEATPKAVQVQRRKPPYIQNKEKQMQRRRWA